ncbi:hypothetical protein [Oryzihumus sp.]
MSDLMEYLLEHIDRDERLANAAGGAAWSAVRVAAECDAKRRILAYAEILVADENTHREGLELMQILASPYEAQDA